MPTVTVSMFASQNTVWRRNRRLKKSSNIIVLGEQYHRLIGRDWESSSLQVIDMHPSYSAPTFNGLQLLRTHTHTTLKKKKKKRVSNSLFNSLFTIASKGYLTNLNFYMAKKRQSCPSGKAQWRLPILMFVKSSSPNIEREKKSSHI